MHKHSSRRFTPGSTPSPSIIARVILGFVMRYAFQLLLSVSIGLMLLVVLVPLHADESMIDLVDGTDMLVAPRPAQLAALPGIASSSSRYQPSAYMAGRVVILAILPESTGAQEPSTENWSAAQIAHVQQQLQAALDWWSARLPNARLSFDLRLVVVPTAYEPIRHPQREEGLWIGDTLRQLGYDGPNHFEQAFTATESLRLQTGSDWATLIFIPNSAADTDGRFADNRYFAYAYINGPFMVVSSDAGPYGTQQLAPVVTHELGHIFGALDQYAAARIPCSTRGGYLGAETSNSQIGNCPTSYPSIMIEVVDSYANGSIDPSALAQLGYRDSDADQVIDVLDTQPLLEVVQRPRLQGEHPGYDLHASDQPFPSDSAIQQSINPISNIEYRVNGGSWYPIVPEDGHYDQVYEQASITLPLYDGSYRIEWRAINAAGIASPIVTSETLIEDVGSAPQFGIEAPTFSQSQAITIGLSAPAEFSSVRVAADLNATQASWVPLQSQLNWQLGSEEGPQQFYIWFKDNQGRESAAQPVQVVYDHTPPTGNVVVYRIKGRQLRVQASDSGSGVEALEIIVEENAAAGSNWQPYTGPLSIDLGAGAISVVLRDHAGNLSPPIRPLEVQSLVYLPTIQH